MSVTNTVQPNLLRERVNGLLGIILPERTPAATHVNAGPSVGSMMPATLRTINNLAPPFEIPYQQEIVAQMQRTFGTVPNVQLIDTATATTMEAFNDLPLERPIWLAPFSNGVHLQYREYMPLFSVNSCALVAPTGFHVVVTPVVINNTQQQLAEQSQNDLLKQYTQMTSIQSLTSNQKRQRVLALQIEHRKTGAAASHASWDDIQFLSAMGANNVSDLAEKLAYLGPMTKDYSDITGNSRSFFGSGSSPILGGRERLLNFSYYTRGKIFNMFSQHPHRGDQLFFSIGEYAPHELDHMQSGSDDSNIACGSSRKRKTTTYVGRTGANSANTVVQIRGWSSRDGMPHLFSPGWMETVGENVVDRHMRTCERQLAYEYREYEQDPLTGDMVAKSVGDGDLQDAVASVPDLIYETVTSSRVTIPVGTVKEPYNATVSSEHLLAAHYSHEQLDRLPHIDIYQNF